MFSLKLMTKYFALLMFYAESILKKLRKMGRFRGMYYCLRGLIGRGGGFPIVLVKKR